MIRTGDGQWPRELWVEQTGNLSNGVFLGDGTCEGNDSVHHDEFRVRTRSISELLEDRLDIRIGPVVGDVLQQEDARFLDRVGLEEVVL